jgi:hypothetical protein
LSCELVGYETANPRVHAHSPRIVDEIAGGQCGAT